MKKYWKITITVFNEQSVIEISRHGNLSVKLNFRENMQTLFPHDNLFYHDETSKFLFIFFILLKKDFCFVNQ